MDPTYNSQETPPIPQARAIGGNLAASALTIHASSRQGPTPYHLSRTSVKMQKFFLPFAAQQQHTLPSAFLTTGLGLRNAVLAILSRACSALQ